MTSIPRFGKKDPQKEYTPRPAVYGVLFNERREVACVVGNLGDIFLPGGGIDAGEDEVSALHREVREECARSISIMGTIGKAEQFFEVWGKGYVLQAAFYTIEFGEHLNVEPEHPLVWLPVNESSPECYHECHEWAIKRAFEQ